MNIWASIKKISEISELILGNKLHKPIFNIYFKALS